MSAFDGIYIQINQDVCVLSAYTSFEISSLAYARRFTSYQMAFMNLEGIHLISAVHICFIRRDIDC